MSNCKNCNQEIKWKEPYVKGDGPLNLDGSFHKCQKKPQSEPLILQMPKGSEIDTKVMSKIRDDAETIAKHNIAKYIGVKKACVECGIDNPAMIGMIFNSVVNNG